MEPVHSMRSRNGTTSVLGIATTRRTERALPARKRAEVFRGGRARQGAVHALHRPVARPGPSLGRPPDRWRKSSFWGPQVTPWPPADGVEFGARVEKAAVGLEEDARGRRSPAPGTTARSYSRMAVRNHRERKPSGSATSAEDPAEPPGRCRGARVRAPDAIRCLENPDRGCTERKRSQRAGSSSSRLSNPKVDSSANAGNCEAHRRTRPREGVERMASGTISSTADSIRSMACRRKRTGHEWFPVGGDDADSAHSSRESEPFRLRTPARGLWRLRATDSSDGDSVPRCRAHARVGHRWAGRGGMVGSGLGGAVAMVVPGPMRMRRTREGGGPGAGEREPPRADSEGQAVGWFAGEHGGPGCGRDVGEGGGLQIPEEQAVGWFAGEHGGPGCGRDAGEGGGLQMNDDDVF